jgi:hypothetical protein
LPEVREKQEKSPELIYLILVSSHEKNIQQRLKICALYMFNGQIWLGFPREDDCHFLYIFFFLCTITTLGCTLKTPF